MRVRPQIVRVIFIVLSAAALSLGACGGSQGAEDSGSSDGDRSSRAGGPDQGAPMTRQSDYGQSRPPRVRYGNINRTGMSTRQTDINRDGEADQIEYFREGTLYFVERDLDFDGTPDLFEYFSPSGDLIEQEFQLDYDLAIDAVRFYSNGVVTEKLVSTEFDGAATIWKYYDEDGSLSRLERDTDSDGVPDEWSRYEDGELVSIEQDTDDDGRPDTEIK